MVKRKYGPANKCIYCPNPSRLPLGNEHIIPRNIGGRSYIEYAACKSCERESSKFENHCAEGMFRAAKAHLGIKGRAKIRRTELGVLVGEGANTSRRKMPLHNHPGTIMVFVYGLPGILVKDMSPKPPVGRLQIKPLHDDMNRRLDELKRLGAKASLIEKPLDSPPFARMLAKIGHCYAVAKFGIDGFEPLLPDLILNEKLDDQLLNYVGTHVSNLAKTNELHTLDHRIIESVKGEKFIAVNVRLFANHDMSTHQVIAGKPISERA